MRDGLPSGTVTFMFTDVEGSTGLLHQLGPEQFADVIQRHREVVRGTVAEHAGVEVDTQGDAFFVAFSSAPAAVDAASAMQARLAATGGVKIRIGLHTGTPLVSDDGYVGVDVHLAARIAAAGHGGQVLLSAQTQALVEHAVRDLGEHRLKDFDRPVRIFQVGAAAFPPLKTLTTSQLPRPASPLIGRSQQLKDVLTLLRDGRERLVTLTGAGGCGKTRLALGVAAELVGTPKAGVYWVDLAALREASLVESTIAQVIGASGDVAEHIKDREMVIVVDNVEHVISAASDLTHLLEACPNLTLIATSRERLRVRGEYEYAVPPLDEPEAVELFVQRAQVPESADVRELCRRLDYLPLAVELAAARARVLTPRQMLDRLARRLDILKGGRDADIRQQTLRATIDWSYDLLDGDEQQLFAHFSVFAGSADLDAAEAVVNADLDVLESLVDKSLIRAVDGRFLMLETIRDYATERLTTSGDASHVQQRHAAYFSSVAESVKPEIMGVEPQTALNRLERDHDNLRAALTWFESIGDTQGALRLAGALWEFWCLRSHFNEGYARLEHLLTLDQTPSRARADALTGATHLSTGAAVDVARVRAQATEALSLQQQFGTEWDIVFAEHQYAQIFGEEGDFAALLTHMSAVVDRWREVGDEHRELQAMRVVAWAYQELGERSRSRETHEEILRRARAIGDREPQWWSLRALATHHSVAGRHADAVDCLREAWQLQEAAEDDSTDVTISSLGVVLVSAGAKEVAATAFGLSERLSEESDFTYPVWLVQPRDEAIAACRDALTEAIFTDAWQQGRAMSPDELFRLAINVVT